MTNMKKILLFNILFLVLLATQTYSQWANDTYFNGIENSSERFGSSVSLSEDGNTLAVSAYRDGEVYDDNGNLDERGSVRIYTKDDANTWIQTTEITSDDIGGQFGRSLSLSSDGTVLAVGAPNAGNGEIVTTTSGNFTFSDIVTNTTGLVRIYENDGDNNWLQIGEDITGENEGEFFGWSVSISGDGNTIASGAYGINNETGTARVYTKNDDDTWSKTGDLSGTDEKERTGFSLSLSKDGTTLALGSDRHDLDKGTTKIYQVDISNSWTQIGNDIDGETEGENSGFSVSLSEDGNTVAIGAYNYNNSQGTVRVYKNVNDNWVKTAQIDGQEDTEDEFGSYVNITPDAQTLAIGAKAYDFSNGVARIYSQNSDATWIQKGDDILSGAPGFSFAFFSTSISLSADGNTAVIGSYAINGNDGKAQVFNYTDTSLSTNDIAFEDINYYIENQKVYTTTTDISLTIFDLLGRKHHNNNLNGVYIVSFMNTTNGSITTEKMLIK